MTADDFKRIAERYSELIHPGEWRRMSDAQRAGEAALLEGFLVRKSPATVTVQ